MDGRVNLGIRRMEEFDYSGKTVLLRVDINSPIDPQTKKIANENRINMSLLTIKYLLGQGAKLAIIAHQGDTLDYHNLVPLKEHAEKLSAKLGQTVTYVDDVCGSAAQGAVKNLESGQAVVLGNLRYLTEEVSTFEKYVKLRPEDMLNTYLVRGLASLVDFYVNDAFAAAHRNAPSMVAFQEILPAAGGTLLIQEVTALNKVLESPEKPTVFVLGGLKISDAFGMMKQVLENGAADKILTCDITGHIMLIASGYNIGAVNEKFIKDCSLDVFVESARSFLKDYPEKILYPCDLAFAKEGVRQEIKVSDFPTEELCLDIGQGTIEVYKQELARAGTIFVNGPAGVYENGLFAEGTREIWSTIAECKGYSVIGGGDTVSAAQRFIDTAKINYVCTAGGAMVRYLSGVKMPLVEAMKKAYDKGIRPSL